MRIVTDTGPRLSRRLSRLLCGSSIAVLAAYAPAMAQVVDITIDRNQMDDVFTAANVTGFDTTFNSTQESRDNVLARIANGALETEVEGSGESSVTIEDNALEATAQGNVSVLTAQNLGTTENEGTIGLLSGQFSDGQVAAEVIESNLTVESEGDATQSSMAASDNTIAARATINEATTVFNDDISADLADQLAQSGQSFGANADDPITLTRGDLAVQELLSVDGGAAVVASTQAATGAAPEGALDSRATITNSTISIELAESTPGANDDATDSALSVSGNELVASLRGNVATTGTDLSVDTTFQGAVGVFSQQQLGDGDSGDVDLRADVTGSDLAITLDNATDSSLDVSENRIGAQARGNVATHNGNGNGNGSEGTFLRVEANEILATTGDPEDLENNPATQGTATIDPGAGTLVVDDGDGDGTGFDFVAATQQSVISEDTGAIKAENTDTSLSVTAEETDGNVSGSSLNIGDNTFFALASANTAGTAVELEATNVTASAVAANDQNVADTDVDAFLGATEFDFDTGAFTGDAVELSADIVGDLTNSTVALDGNLSVAEAQGNVGRTDLAVSATNIDRAITGESGAGDIQLNTDESGEFAVNADFASLNVQNQTGNITSLNQTEASVSAADVDGSRVSIDENTLQSDAISNLATNRVTLEGSAGINETTTAIGSAQVSGDPLTDRVDVESAVGGTFTVTAVELDASRATIDGNQAFGSATSNRVVNEISLTGNAISGADGTASVGVVLEPQVGQQIEADNGLSSVQISAADVSSFSSLDGTATIGAGGIDGSRASVSENFARSFGSGNEAVNRLAIAADTTFSGASGLVGTQVQVGDVSSQASVEAEITTAADGTLNESQAAIDENIAFSRSLGNDQTNELTISGTSIEGVTGDAAEIANLGGALSAMREIDADNVLSATQGLRNGDVTGEASVDGTITIADTISGSSVSASDNIAQSNVTGSRGNNLLSLDAATGVTGVSALTSEQVARADEDATNAITSTADLEFSIDQAADTQVTNSALNVDGNVGFSTAIGNDVTNRLEVSGTTITGRQTDLSSANISADGVVSGTSDNLLGNFQTRNNDENNAAADTAVTSTASLTVDVLNTSSNAPDSLANSSVSVSDNILDSTATSNRARNTLDLAAETTLSAGGAIVNRQDTDSEVNSDVSLRVTGGSGDLGGLGGSSIAVRDNVGIARAAGNDAVNVLNARGGTAINGTAGDGEATVGAGGVLNATGDFAIATSQRSTGAITARASFGEVGDPTQSSLGVQTAALNASSVDLSGNRLVADAVSNRVENRLTVSGRSASDDVSASVVTRQVASGDVTSRVDTFRVTSANGALTSSSVNLGNNTISASATGNSAVTRLLRD